MKIHIVHVKDNNANDNANRTAAWLYKPYFARRRSVIPIHDLTRKHGCKLRMLEGDNVCRCKELVTGVPNRINDVVVDICVRRMKIILR